MRTTLLNRVGASAALLCCILTSQVTAQTAAAGISPVPIWPSTGIVPQELQGQHVFLDPSTNQVIVSYVDDQGSHKLVRFDREDQVDLAITAAVTVRPDGQFTYDYTLQNGGRAKRPLKEWTLIVGAPTDQLTATHAAWHATSHASPLPRPGSIRPDMALTWSGPTRAAVVPVVGALAGFRVMSTYTPGLTLAYGSALVPTPYAVAAAQAFPTVVAQQLTPIVNPTWNAAQVLTIGPKYSPSDPKGLIAMDFHRSLNQLIVNQLLKADSPFVSGALAALETFMLNTESGSPALEFLAQANPGLEAQIAAAMAFSLR